MDPNRGQDTTQPSEERRRIERFDLRLPGRIEELSCPPDRAPVALNLMTKDISACGAFFPCSARSFEEGTRVKVDLVLVPLKGRASQVKRALIQVNGTVVRNEPGGMAVGFDKKCTLTPLNET
jgi:hypothetical protein